MIDAIATPNRPKIAVQHDGGYFPIARVFGIGRNYSETPKAEKKDSNLTVLFMKDAYMVSDAAEGIVYPHDTTQLRYEIELVVAIGKEGFNVPPEKADEYIFGYAVGIDFTKYDAQEIAKKHAWPWDRGKSFVGCAPCSPITPKNAVTMRDNNIWLNKNNIKVQNGTLGQMIWTIPETVSLVSTQFGLLPGDLIFTGTPQGIGMVSKGDLLEGAIDGLESIRFLVS